MLVGKLTESVCEYVEEKGKVHQGIGHLKAVGGDCEASLELAQVSVE